MGIKRFVLDLASMAARSTRLQIFSGSQSGSIGFVNELHASGLSVARHAGIKV